MLACISKNDRASLLFEELRRLNPTPLDLGSLRSSRRAQLWGAISSLSSSLAQSRSDMNFSPAVAADLQHQTEAKLAKHHLVSHVLQWGAMYPPVPKSSAVSFSIITDGPFDPEDTAYPVEWRPVRWRRNYLARQRDVYSRAEYVFALSDWARNKLIAVHSLDPARVVRIGWGPMFSVEEPNLHPAEPAYFVSIGNQWFRKGMDIVAEAGRQIHTENPTIKTLIAGLPEGLKIPAMAGVKQNPKRVPLTEVKKLIAGARGLIVASRFDASPHIIMEALQLGTPVIGTDVCGIGEVVGGPAGGRLIGVNDAVALAEAMSDLLREDVREQRTRARAAYVKFGGWKRAAQIVFDTLQLNELPIP